MKVALLTGPESAGKSSLCAALAQHFGAPVVAEYVREFIVQQQRDTCYADVQTIARTQCQRIEAARALAPPLLLLDTDLHSNRLWSRTLFGRSPAWINTQLAQAPRYDAVFLLSPQGLPWQADGLRCQPALAERQVFHAQLAQQLAQQGQRVIEVGGDWDQRYQQLQGQLLELLSK